MPTSVPTDSARTTSTCSTDHYEYNMHRGVEKAVHLMWNNEYKAAMELLRGKKDTHPRYSLEWANCYLVKSLMNSTSEEYEKLLDLFKAADSLATNSKYNEMPLSDDDESEELNSSSVTDTKQSKKEREHKKRLFKARMKDAPKSDVRPEQTWKLECDAIYADALLLRAICQLMMNSYLKGGINLRKAWGCFHALIQRVEKDTDDIIPHKLKMCIKYGTGTFYAFLALVPANLMKLLSIIGFISDRDLGEQYLTEVFDSNTIRSPFAALVLCTLFLFLPTGLGDVEDTLSKAKRVLETMNQRYPDNTYFNGYANFYYRKKGDTDLAVKSITLASANAEKAGLVPLLIQYLHADTLFMDQQWAPALQGYKSLLAHVTKTKESFAYIGQVVLSIAACNVMLADDDEAMSWMKKVGVMYNTKSKSDSNSHKFASRVLANPRLLPLAGVYMLYINRDLAHMTKEQGMRVMSELQRVCKGKDLSGPEAENMHRLFTSVIKKGSGDVDGAMACMQSILDDEKKIPQDSMILPFTYYELAEMVYRRGNKQEAKRLFERGCKIKGDGNETLNNRYSIAMKQLRKSMETAD